jgi:hypothetical protein
MISKNLRSIKLLTTSRFTFSSKPQSHWMDSPFITKVETPAYFAMWSQMNQHHERESHQQMHSESLGPSSCQSHQTIVAGEDGLAQAIAVSDDVNIAEQTCSKNTIKSRGGRRLKAVNTRPFKK